MSDEDPTPGDPTDGGSTETEHDAGGDGAGEPAGDADGGGVAAAGDRPHGDEDDDRGGGGAGGRDGDPAEELRGRLYTELDLLAFALEMEAAERLDAGDRDEVRRLQDRRLGVRLAQRLVSGVSSDEVDGRLRRWRAVYRRRLEETRTGDLTAEPFRLAGPEEEG